MSNVMRGSQRPELLAFKRLTKDSLEGLEFFGEAFGENGGIAADGDKSTITSDFA